MPLSIEFGMDICSLSDSMNFAPLCKSCRSIFKTVQIPASGSHRLELRGRFTNSLLDLKRSSKWCHLCWLRLSQIAQKGRQRLSKEDSVDDEYCLSFWTIVSNQQQGRLQSILHEVRNVRVLLATQVLRMSAWSSTEDQSTFDMIDDWITTCEKKHATCIERRSIQNTAFRPKRILDLGSSSEGNDIRLVLGASLTTMASFRYLTLSYRWGDGHPLQLRRSTTAQFFHGIPGQSLPPLFRDVVRIARRLKIQYLWIDSLCIEQDSNDDWKMVTAEMGAVYTNSWLNIAAVAASNCEDTCFTTRPRSAMHPFMVRAPLVKPYVFHALNSGSWQRDISEHPFSNRAWILQERFLATRILFFTRTKVYWECCMTGASESGPERVPKGHTGPFARTLLQKPEEYNRPDYRFSNPGRTRIWMEAVEEYSRCTLTNTQKDIFVAIAGIAGSLGPPEDYIAGLWLTDLMPLLLWHRAPSDVTPGEHTTTKRSPLSFRTAAPSWSWLSLSGPVNFGEEPDVVSRPDMWTRMASVFHASVHAQDTRYPFCDIKPGGYIVLSTHLLTIYPGNCEGMTVTYWPDDTALLAENNGRAFCAILYGANNEMQGICLERLKTKGTYRRVGQFFIAVHRWGPVNRMINREVLREECYLELLQDKSYSFEDDMHRVYLSLPTYKIKII